MSPARQLVFGLAVGLAVPEGGLPARQLPPAPTILAFTVNNGVSQTTIDTVTLRWTAAHPAAPGKPLPWYRIRYRSPVDVAWPAWGPYVANERGISETPWPLQRRSGGDPLVGVHRFELQLKDANGQESGVATASILRALPTAPPAPSLVPYDVTGDAASEVVRYAEANGFDFEAVALNQHSTCLTADESGVYRFRTIRALIPNVVGPAQCHFRLFANRQLNAGWRMKQVAVATVDSQSGCSFKVLVPPKPFGSDASAVAEGIVAWSTFGLPACPFIDGRVWEVRLEGPQGGDWRDAFRD